MDTTVVVTGASRGLGAAVTRAFAREGAHVVACSRSAEDLEGVAGSLGEAAGRVTTQRADVRDEFDAERLMETAARASDAGRIDVLFANAGVYHGSPGETPLAEESYAAFDEHVRTNGRGVFAAVREAIPHLAPEARVLVPSGPIAREAKAGYGSYAASKALAEAIVRQFAAELDVPVGIVDPGQLSTELTDGARGRDPEDVAGMVVWAATEAPAEAVDGDVVDLRAWRQATR